MERVGSHGYDERMQTWEQRIRILARESPTEALREANQRVDEATRKGEGLIEARVMRVVALLACVELHQAEVEIAALMAEAPSMDVLPCLDVLLGQADRKSTRLNSSH